MIKAVSLDFYGTLARWAPAMEVVQAEACAAEGIRVSQEALVRGYTVADAFMAAENARSPVPSRSEAEHRRFLVEYEQRLLEAAGVVVPLDVAARIWDRVHNAPKDFALYEDALPSLRDLSRSGLTVGVISNMGSNLIAIMERLGLSQVIRFSATSSEAGVGKPHAGIFRLALARAGVAPEEAVHVGDDYAGDVVGALSSGMRALLLARSGPETLPGDCPVIGSLCDVLPYLRSHGHLGPGPGA